VDLCSSLEMPGHEAIRERIRTGALTPAAVAALRPEELLSQSERTELAKRVDQFNRDHDIGEITRQVASVTKVDECPSCKHMEAAVLEQGNQGGAPRFWGGGEEEQQTMTLLQCLNCRHEWVREAKY
jgi:hypothetical protein